MKRLGDGSMLLPAHLYSWRNPAWAAKLGFMKGTDWPILVGPWHGEIGFEVLYWIPFIQTLMRAGIAPERIIPIARGGSASWYGVPAGLELYAMRTPQDIRVERRIQMAKTGLLKQEARSDFDAGVLRDAAETLKLGQKYHVVDPAWMFHRLAPFWSGHRGAEWLAPRTHYQRLMAPSVPDAVKLPESYIAMRFYSRRTFPIKDKHVYPFMRAVIEQCVQTHDVVLLDTDLSLDDHADLTREVSGKRIHHLSEYVNLLPEQNLALSSAILQRATGFIGTYGGFAQLALRLGTPSVSFFTEWHATSLAHKALADLLSVRTGIPAYVLRVGDLPMLHTVLPEATFQVKKKPMELQPA